MVVCAECIVIPNCYRFELFFSGKRDTCCKCKEYKEYVIKVAYYNCAQNDRSTRSSKKTQVFK